MFNELDFSLSALDFPDLSGEELRHTDSGGGFAVTRRDEGSGSLARSEEKEEENSEWLEMVGRFIRSIDIDEL